MARGWESKDVESQQEQREAARKPGELMSDAAQQRKSLELQRKRIVGELERATHERYRWQLEDAIAHLDKQLAALPKD